VGMNGTKKLKEFFVDEKVPREQREKIPIISINDKIAAVSDMRTDKHYVYGKNKINFKVILRRCSIGK
jgi:tRNA(Ile)-lysidine synthase